MAFCVKCANIVEEINVYKGILIKMYINVYIDEYVINTVHLNRDKNPWG